MLLAVSETPQLVRDDPWLESHAGAIAHRLHRFHFTQGDIEARSGSLSAYATGHKLTGIHRQPDGHWMVREWLPKAKAVSLIGDFNGWNRESHPLAPAFKPLRPTAFREPNRLFDHSSPAR